MKSFGKYFFVRDFLINPQYKTERNNILSNTINTGDKVKVHYTGSLEDGSVFDTSDGRDPLEFTIGESQVIPGFEKAVLDLNPGESTKITIPSNQAYGEVREDMMVEVERAKLPDNITPQLGLQLALNQPDGQSIPVIISKLTESHITLDANHPLAGKDLTFEIELVSVN